MTAVQPQPQPQPHSVRVVNEQGELASLPQFPEISLYRPPSRFVRAVELDRNGLRMQLAFRRAVAKWQRDQAEAAEAQVAEAANAEATEVVEEPAATAEPMPEPEPAAEQPQLEPPTAPAEPQALTVGRIFTTVEAYLQRHPETLDECRLRGLDDRQARMAVAHALFGDAIYEPLSNANPSAQPAQEERQAWKPQTRPPSQHARRKHKRSRATTGR